MKFMRESLGKSFKCVDWRASVDIGYAWFIEVDTAERTYAQCNATATTTTNGTYVVAL